MFSIEIEARFSLFPDLKFVSLGLELNQYDMSRDEN